MFLVSEYFGLKLNTVACVKDFQLKSERCSATSALQLTMFGLSFELCLMQIFQRSFQVKIEDSKRVSAMQFDLNL